MKSIYRCDGCDQDFENWKECLDHEDAHLKIKSSQLIFNLRDSHPETVKITFNDDSFGYYDLLGKFQEPQRKSPPATDNSEEGQQ